MWAILKKLTVTVVLLISSQLVLAQQITVSKNSPVSTLKQAIAIADPHDTIVLQAGTYPEHDIVINKPLTIEGRGNVIIDGERKGFVLVVRSDSVTIRGLNVQHAKVSFINDNAAILLDGVGHCVIENNILKDNFFGIYLAKSYDTIVRNNNISGHFTSESASGNGIHLWYSKNITVKGNRVDGQRDGIYFEFVENSHISDNYSTHNLRYGLHFMFSDNCTYTNNTFRDNSAGVAVMYTHHVKMEGNHFIHNWGSASYGLLLKEITDSSIKNNVFEHNTIGIYTEASNRIQVEHNEFLQNGWAARV
ncbi:MAG: nitrous oxide reductase family maturation protein NosD, partial [Balneolaceae bacterium]